MVASAPAADLRPPRRYVLPEGLRRELGAAFGPIVQSSELVAALEGADTVLAVGDVVSLTLKTLGVTPALFVCDYQTQRGLPEGRTTQETAKPVSRDVAAEKSLYELELGNWGELAFRVRNPATTITREAWDAIRLGLQHDEGPVRVVVEGEEDLLGIPCFLEAPNGSVVLYGMPNQGVVVVRVDAAFKNRVADLLAKFTRE